MTITCWWWLTVRSWIMCVAFLNKTSRWFKYVCIKMWTCKISARFHSLTEMSRDRNGPDRNVPRPKRLRPNRPYRKVAYRFQKQMYGIEESACDIVGTFRRPRRHSAPLWWLGAQGCGPLPPFSASSKFYGFAVSFIDWLSKAIEQGFSTFFCSWPTKLVRNGVGPLTFNEKHQVSTTQ